MSEVMKAAEINTDVFQLHQAQKPNQHPTPWVTPTG